MRFIALLALSSVALGAPAQQSPSAQASPASASSSSASPAIASPSAANPPASAAPNNAKSSTPSSSSATLSSDSSTSAGSKLASLTSGPSTKYVIVLKTGSSDSILNTVLATLTKSGLAATLTYRINGFVGFSANLPAGLVTALKLLPDVAYLEPDIVVRTTAMTTQKSTPYGLARISHKTTSTSYTSDYVYDTTAGAGTCAYIIDSGIDASHSDFGGRATMAYNAYGGANTDEFGHGTHVAGTVGSNTYGVAKKTKLFGVKVLGKDGTGSLSQILAGMDWAAKDAAAARRDGRCPKGTVATMSLATGSKSQSLNDAAKQLVNSGLFLAAAAGNSNANVQTQSPGSEPSACTVAAVDNKNVQASFSNYGDGVDVYAPGVSILSTYLGGKTQSMSGTSMATPHVAGLAAYLLGLDSTPSGSRSSTALCSYVQQLAIKSIVKDSSGKLAASSTNYLVYNNNGA